MSVGTCPVCGNAASLHKPRPDAQPVTCPIDGDFSIAKAFAETQKWQNASANERLEYLEVARAATPAGKDVVIRAAD